MAHAIVNGKKKYYRDRGEGYQVPEVITLNEEDICPVCQWPFGTKKTFIHDDSTITHDKHKCKVGYIGQ
jgi:hypothetical protein